jgi:hypothetical protein
MRILLNQMIFFETVTFFTYVNEVLNVTFK